MGFFLSKTQDLVFKKPFSKRYIWKKGGSSYILVNTVIGKNLATSFRLCLSCLWPWLPLFTPHVNTLACIFLVYWSTHVWYVTGKHPYYVFKQIQQEQVFHCRRGGNISNFNSFLTQEIINVFSSCTAYSHRNCKHESRILAQVSRWHFGILWGF